MRVALVHDWLTGMRGGENVLEAFCEIFPEADLYTLIHIPGAVSKTIEDRNIYTSFLQKIPGVEKNYRWFLPLMPRAIESLKLEGYDLILSSSHCVAKGVRPHGAPHLCYCHTPMRYAWDMYDDYFNPRRMSKAKLFAIGLIMPYLRRWDRRTASRVDLYLANSINVKKRIKRIYNADAEVLYPPVDVDFYTPAEGVDRREYLVVSAFAPYKRVDLAIELFNSIGEPLVIVGSGEDEERLRAMAGPNIRFESSVPRERLRELYRSARALVYPGEEDFGIIPVEAMACGAPVIAFGKGGALETVKPFQQEAETGCTGVFFERQTVEDMEKAVRLFEANIDAFDTGALRRNAERFARGVFMRETRKLVSDFLGKRGV